MTENPASSPKREIRKSSRTLLFWLALFPFIFAGMFLCGQAPFFLPTNTPWMNTRSLLQATYMPWSYGSIPPLLIKDFMSDVHREMVINGTSLPPSVAFMETVIVLTDSAASHQTETSAARSTDDAAHITITPTPSRTSLPPTSTTTPTQPSPTATRTPVATLPLLPQPTSTDPPEEPNPTRTRAVPSQTSTPAPPASTDTPVPPTATPAEPTPTYAPVRPIAENNGASIAAPGGGCQAFFGYQNDNVQEVEILPDATRNSLSQPAVINIPALPGRFQVGRVESAFQAVWNVPGQDLIWSLDGRTATAFWCNPPAP